MAADDFPSSAGVSRRSGAPPGARGRKAVLEWLIILPIALLVATLGRAHVGQQYSIESSSMEPTLEVGQRLLVTKLGWDGDRVPARGEIILFPHPETGETLIKRVVGLPGESVELTGVDEVRIGDDEVAQPWAHVPASAEFGPVTVPDGHVFVLGDNRPASADSRSSLGPVPIASIIGTAEFTIWPSDRIGPVRNDRPPRGL